MYLLHNNARIMSTKTKNELEFDLIAKQENNIYCYKNNEKYLSLIGVKIKDYQVEGGSFTVEKTNEELQAEINAQLLKDSANLQIQLKKQQELNANLLIKIAQIGGRY